MSEPPNTYTDPDHEYDPRWSAVDAYALNNLHPASRPNRAALLNALESSAENDLPPIQCFPAQAKFLALQCRMLNVQSALEIGTLGGYTAIWLASENPGMRVTTIEVDTKYAEVARTNIERAGLAGRVDVITGEALLVLPRLWEEMERVERVKFGFVFIDADKVNNWAYFQWAIKMSVQPRGCIVVDNVVRWGQVADEEDKSPGVLGSRKLIEEVGKDERVDAVVLQTVGQKSYDGFLMAVVK